MSTYRLQSACISLPLVDRNKVVVSLCLLHIDIHVLTFVGEAVLRFPQIYMCHSDFPPPSTVAVLHESAYWWESYPIELCTFPCEVHLCTLNFVAGK